MAKDDYIHAIETGQKLAREGRAVGKITREEANRLVQQQKFNNILNEGNNFKERSYDRGAVENTRERNERLRRQAEKERIRKEFEEKTRIERKASVERILKESKKGKITTQLKEGKFASISPSEKPFVAYSGGIPIVSEREAKEVKEAKEKGMSWSWKSHLMSYWTPISSSPIEGGFYWTPISSSPIEEGQVLGGLQFAKPLVNVQSEGTFLQQTQQKEIAKEIIKTQESFKKEPLSFQSSPYFKEIVTDRGTSYSLSSGYFEGIGERAKEKAKEQLKSLPPSTKQRLKQTESESSIYKTTLGLSEFPLKSAGYVGGMGVFEIDKGGYKEGEKMGFIQKLGKDYLGLEPVKYKEKDYSIFQKSGGAFGYLGEIQKIPSSKSLASYSGTIFYGTLLLSSWQVGGVQKAPAFLSTKQKAIQTIESFSPLRADVQGFYGTSPEYKLSGIKQTPLKGDILKQESSFIGLSGEGYGESVQYSKMIGKETFGFGKTTQVFPQKYYVGGGEFVTGLRTQTGNFVYSGGGTGTASLIKETPFGIVGKEVGEGFISQPFYKPTSDIFLTSSGVTGEIYTGVGGYAPTFLQAGVTQQLEGGKFITAGGKYSKDLFKIKQVGLGVEIPKSTSDLSGGGWGGLKPVTKSGVGISTVQEAVKSSKSISPTPIKVSKEVSSVTTTQIQKPIQSQQVLSQATSQKQVLDTELKMKPQMLLSQATSQKSRTKQKSASILKSSFRQGTSQQSAQGLGLRLGTNLRLKTKQTQTFKTPTKQIITPRVRTNIPIPPFLKGGGFGFPPFSLFGGGGRGKKGRTSKLIQPQAYQPSLSAGILGIKGRKPKPILGEFKFGFLPGLRPIVSSPKKRKKKKK